MRYNPMEPKLTDLHVGCLAQAFREVLEGEQIAEGTMAFASFLPSDVAKQLPTAPGFSVPGWEVYCVTDRRDAGKRWITADQAVQDREGKKGAILLLIDTSVPATGMDGIFSSAREVVEEEVVPCAQPLALEELGRPFRAYAKHAAEQARLMSAPVRASHFSAFDYICRVASDGVYPGNYLALLGFWPAEKPSPSRKKEDEVGESRWLVECLLGPEASQTPPEARVESVLPDASEEQRADLVAFLRKAATMTILEALKLVSGLRPPDEALHHLWVNNLRIPEITGIRVVPWRNRDGKVAPWSGLVDGDNERGLPELRLGRKGGTPAKLTVKWTTRPERPWKADTRYLVEIRAEGCRVEPKVVKHAKRKEQKYVFPNECFKVESQLEEIEATAVVSVVDKRRVNGASDPFLIIVNQGDEHTKGRRVRAFSEGMAHANTRDELQGIVSSGCPVKPERDDLKMALPGGSAYLVARPPLIKAVEGCWIADGCPPGRWRMRVRDNGGWEGVPEFIPLPEGLSGRLNPIRQEMAGLLMLWHGGVGLTYGEEFGHSTVIDGYLSCWEELLEAGGPEASLANTVEVRRVSGAPLGLVVLPTHPLRMAWHAAYDSLVFDTRFEQETSASTVLRELRGLSGSMFPPFLPGAEGGRPYVFGKMLGFHAVCMLREDDEEPEATTALIGRVLNKPGPDTEETDEEKQVASLLCDQVRKYQDCHESSVSLHLHALKAGTGKVVARSLGRARRPEPDDSEEEEEVEQPEEKKVFVLELYPPPALRGESGRFISDVQEARRVGNASVSEDDEWIGESLKLPGNVNLPLLRWARRDGTEPQIAAHIAIMFDALESKVIAEGEAPPPPRPPKAFGLMAFLERRYSRDPHPVWVGTLPSLGRGAEHPRNPEHTRRLARLQMAVLGHVAASLGKPGAVPGLRTEMTPDKWRLVEGVHDLCDWVISLQQHGGIEHLDSPHESAEVYSRHVIDHYPESRVLENLQLTTSTTNLAEVEALLAEVFRAAGLLSSKQNARFVLENVKALSGRSAIQLTGQVAPPTTVIGLAICHACCREASSEDPCWLPLSTGFFVPVGEIRALMHRGNRKEDAGIEPYCTEFLHVSTADGHLRVRFVVVAHSASLRLARQPGPPRETAWGTGSLQSGWWEHHRGNVCESFRAIRIALLSRLLNHHLARARRHNLREDCHREMSCIIDRMVADNSLDLVTVAGDSRAWVFCPEHAGTDSVPLRTGAPGARAYMFGTGRLPDRRADVSPE